MCKREEESIEHLFNTCLFDSMANNARNFQQTDRDKKSINETIRKWRKGGYKSEVLNRAWKLSIGFLLWGYGNNETTEFLEKRRRK